MIQNWNPHYCPKRQVEIIRTNDKQNVDNCFFASITILVTYEILNRVRKFYIHRTILNKNVKFELILKQIITVKIPGIV